jgi:hypothetical protein
LLKNVGMLTQHICTRSIGTCKAKTESGWVLVALQAAGRRFDHAATW